MGIVFPSVFIAVGMLCAYSGQTYFHNQWHNVHGTPALTWVDGTAAKLGVGFYISLGLWGHFTYYWYEKPALEKYSPFLSNLTLITALVFGCWAALI